MPTSRIDLINRALPKAFRGYSCTEVDRLMQDMSDALARVTEEKVFLAAKLTDAVEEAKKFREREAAMQETLVASHRMNESVRTAAQKEAQLILDTARVKADALLQNANVRLERILEEIENAKKAKAQFEMKLKAVIEGHLRLLELERQEAAALETSLPKRLPPDTLTGAGRSDGVK